MTDGRFYYGAEGKLFKVFGPDDHDALLLLKPHLQVQFVSADKRGFEISKRRISDDMNFPLTLVSSCERLAWLSGQAPLQEVAYMGDGMVDRKVLKAVGYGIVPANGHEMAKSAARFVTVASGGDRAVCEACLHLLRHFFPQAYAAEFGE